MTPVPALPTLGGCIEREENPATGFAPRPDEMKGRGGSGVTRIAAAAVAAALLLPAGRGFAKEPEPCSNLDLLRRAGQAAAASAVDSIAPAIPNRVALQAVREDSTRLFWEALLVETLARQGFEVVRLDPQRPKPGPGPGASGAMSGIGVGPAAAAALDSAAASSDTSAAATEGEAAATDTSSAPAWISGAPASGRVVDPAPYQGPRLRFESESLGFVYPRGHGGWLFGGGEVERYATAGIFLTYLDGSEGAVKNTSRGHGTAIDRVSEEDLARLSTPPLPLPTPDWKGSSIFGRIAEPALVTGIVGGLVYLFYANRSN